MGTKIQEGSLWSVRLYTDTGAPLAAQHFADEQAATHYASLLKEQGYRCTLDVVPWAQSPERARCVVIANAGWAWLYRQGLRQKLPRLGNVPQSPAYDELVTQLGEAALEPNEAKVTSTMTALIALCRNGVRP